VIKMLEITIKFDGACDNRGDKIMGVGVLGIVKLNGTYLDDIEWYFNFGMGTSMIAEWMGLLLSVKMAKEIIAKHKIEPAFITIHTDSQVVERQFTGVYDVHEEGLKPFHRVVMEQIAGMPKIIIKWGKRNKNTEADALSKKGLNQRTINFWKHLLWQ